MQSRSEENIAGHIRLLLKQRGLGEASVGVYYPHDETKKVEIHVYCDPFWPSKRKAELFDFLLISDGQNYLFGGVPLKVL